MTIRFSAKQKGPPSFELLIGIVLISVGCSYLFLAPIIHGVWILLLGSVFGFIGAWVVKHLATNFLNSRTDTTISVDSDQVRVENDYGFDGVLLHSNIRSVVKTTVGSRSGRMGWEISAVTQDNRVLLFCSFRDRHNKIADEIFKLIGEYVTIEELDTTQNTG